MREILFRGKRKDNGKWMYGDVFHNHDGRVFVGELIVDDYKGLCHDRYTIGTYFYEVEPITITQFLNNIDRNGDKLFEGDIVNVYQYKRDDKPSCVAIVIDNSTLIEDGLGRWKPQDTVRVEVIGNIFDNPELLSEGNKRWVEHYWDIPEDCYSAKWAW